MEKKKKEFSKVLLIQESALIWILSISFIGLAFYCIYRGFTGSLPWLAAMVGFPWTAYGVSQVYYYKKSLAENTKNGVKYESVIASLDQAYSKYASTASSINFDTSGDTYYDSSYVYTPTTESVITQTDINIDYGI